MNQTPDPSSWDIAPEVKTLLATDLVSSTKFIEELGDDVAANIFAQHDRLIRDLAVKHKGQEIDKTDGFLFLFARPTDAVKFSLSYHDALKELSGKSGQELATRIGIHLGEVLLRKNKPEDVQRGAKPLEVEGLAKHLVARVMSLATGHQTLLTAPPFQLARRTQTAKSPYPEDTAWLKHGHYSMKGIDEPVLIYEVGRRGTSPLTAPISTEKAKRIQGRVQSVYDASPVQPVSKKSKTLASTLLGLVLIAGLGFAYVMLQTKPEPKTPDAVSERTKPVKKPKQDTRPLVKSKSTPPSDMPFVLHLTSRPGGALFEIEDGAVLGTAPTTLELPPKERQIRLKATLEGYRPATVVCVIGVSDLQRKSTVCTAELQKLNLKRTPQASPPPNRQKLEGYKENPFGNE
jgi:class 3 adenylate cyclase